MKNLIKSSLMMLVLQFGSITASADECLTVASIPEHTGSLSEITPGIKAAFRKAGVCADYISMPDAEMKKKMTEGKIDAEFVRVKTYIEAMQRHVIHIPTPVISSRGLIVTLSSNGFRPMTLTDIGDQKIGVIQGIAWQKRTSEDLKNVIASKEPLALAEQMKSGRIDGFLIEEGQLNRLIAAGILSENEIHRSRPIADASTYMVLHKKNADLVGKLDEAMQKIRNEGGFLE